MRNTIARSSLFGFAFLVACGGGGSNTGPTDVEFNVTTYLVVANPVINEITDDNIASPGAEQEGLAISVDDDSLDTNADGIAIFADLAAGAHSLTAEGATGTVEESTQEGELHEIALAVDDTAAKMHSIRYPVGDVFEVTPDMTIEEVNDALGVSDRTVFIHSGTYTGDIDFSGSQVILFGAGLTGGEVTIDGNLTISGSDSKVRGATVTGNVTITGSGVSMSFSRVDGDVSIDSSDITLLSNALCGTTTDNGSGTIALGNKGIAPVAQCE